MPKKDQPITISAEQIERQIYILRGRWVMLNHDLALLYGLSTKAFDEAFQSKIEWFPEDFAYQLTAQEAAGLRSQFLVANPARGKRQPLPWAFTEQGVAMLPSVFRSPSAVPVNIEVLRSFARLRRLLATPGDLVAHFNKLAESVQRHDEQLKVITQAVSKMIQLPSKVIKQRLGSHPPEPSSN